MQSIEKIMGYRIADALLSMRPSKEQIQAFMARMKEPHATVMAQREQRRDASIHKCLARVEDWRPYLAEQNSK